MADMMIAVERLMRRQLMLRGARSSFIRNAGGTIHFLEIRGRGALPPVALIHGFSAAAATQYSQMIRLLKPHVSKIVAPDLPGHGLSVMPEEGLTSPVMTNALRDALDAAFAEPAVVFASSLGGAIAARFAATHPDRVLKLVLCSPGGAPIPDHEMEAFLQTFRVDSHRDALRFVDNLFARPSAIRHMLAYGVRQQFNRPHMVEMLKNVSPSDFLTPEELRSLTMPILLIWGKEERVLPNHNLAFFREHLPPHAEIEEPETFGHAPFLDEAPELVRRILEFAAKP